MSKISIIVPVYNVEKYIKRCIESIIGQTFTDFDLILVDDGSSDNSAVVCEEYEKIDSRIKVLHQKNQGVSVARNTGIEWSLSKSDSGWITFIDSDDWVHKKYLDSLFNGVSQYNVPISMCWAIKTEGEESEPENFDVYLRKVEDAYTYNGKFIAAFPWGRLYRKELFLTYRFPKGKLWEDLYLMHKILFQFAEIAVIEQPLYYYYRNAESIIRQKWSPRKMDGLYAYEEEIFPYFKNKYPKVYRIAQRSYYLAVAELALEAGQAGCKKDARRLKWRLRFKMISFHNTSNFPISEYCWVYELAFPLFMKLYWIADSIQRKIKNYIEIGRK